jgi:hypothetical protein
VLGIRGSFPAMVVVGDGEFGRETCRVEGTREEAATNNSCSVTPRSTPPPWSLLRPPPSAL